MYCKLENHIPLIYNKRSLEEPVILSVIIQLVVLVNAVEQESVSTALNTKQYRMLISWSSKRSYNLECRCDPGLGAEHTLK